MFSQLMQISGIQNDSITHALSGSNVNSLPAYFNLPNICLILIIIFLLTGIIIYAKKLSNINTSSKVDVNFMARIRDYIHDGKIEAANSLCRSMSTPAGRLIEKGIGRIGNQVNDLYFSMDSLGKIEAYRLGKGIQILLSMTAVVIIIGILGSLFSINSLIISGQGSDIGSIFHMKSSYLLDVEAGLASGLIIYLAYRQLISKLSCFSFSMQKITGDFMDLLNEPVK
jgi:biopolymer transport protein ExbB